MKRLLTILLVFICVKSFATIRLVPSQYKTIQSALNASKAGDTILVSRGIYRENINWPQTNNLHLSGSDLKNPNVIIDGRDSGRVINIAWSGSKIFKAEINGFVIQNGFLNVPAHMGGRGAGIFASSAVLKISNCLFARNKITSTFALQNSGGGAGIHIEATPAGFSNTISNCNFIQNSISEVTNGSGTAIELDNAPLEINNAIANQNSMSVEDVGIGTIYAYQSNIKINDVKIENNTIATNENILQGTAAIKGGALFIYLSDATITNLLADNNKLTPFNTGLVLLGSGIYFYGEGSALKISNSTIANNSRTDGAPVNGTAVYYSSFTAATAVIANTVLWNPDNGPEIYNQSKKITATYSDVRNGYNGTANINANPQFISATDFHAQKTSPCINAGNNAAAPSKDLDGNKRPSPVGSNADLGCYETDQSAVADAIIAGSLNHSFNIYPNPSNGKFNLSANENLIGSDIELVNASGKIYFHGRVESTNANYDFSKLADGVYYIIIQNNLQGHIALKLLIEK